MSFWENILYGTLASLIATIAWVVLNKSLSFNARDNNSLLLEEAENISRQVCYNLIYYKYDLALIGCFNLYKILKRIRNNLFYLNYFGLERKLFFTYIYQIEGIINIARNLTVGGKNQLEEETLRCEKLLNTYFRVDNHHTIEILLTILRQLNETKDCAKSFKNIYITKDIAFKLVDVNYFKREGKDSDLLRKKCFTQQEYKKFLDKYFPS